MWPALGPGVPPNTTQSLQGTSDTLGSSWKSQPAQPGGVGVTISLSWTERGRQEELMLKRKV